jgi:hypothetical protein
MLAAMGALLIAQSNPAAAWDDRARLATPQAQPPSKLLQLEEQAAETCAAADNAPSKECDSILATLMEYLKDMSREAREASDMRRMARQTALAAKTQALKRDQQALDNQRQESGERFDAAMGTVDAAPDSAGKAADAGPCRARDAKCADPCKQPSCP